MPGVFEATEGGQPVGVKPGVQKVFSREAEQAALGRAVGAGIKGFKDFRTNQATEEVKGVIQENVDQIEAEKRQKLEQTSRDVFIEESDASPRLKKLDRSLASIKNAEAQGAISSEDRNIKVRALISEVGSRFGVDLDQVNRSLAEAGFAPRNRRGDFFQPTQEEKDREKFESQINTIQNRLGVSRGKAILVERTRARAEVRAVQDQLLASERNATSRDQTRAVNSQIQQRLMTGMIDVKADIEENGVRDPNKSKALFNIDRQFAKSLVLQNNNLTQADQDRLLKQVDNQYDSLNLMIDQGSYDTIVGQVIDNLKVDAELDFSKSDPTGFKINNQFGPDVYLKYLEEVQLALRNPEKFKILQQAGSTITDVMGIAFPSYWNDKELSIPGSTPENRRNNLLFGTQNLLDASASPESKAKSFDQLIVDRGDNDAFYQEFVRGSSFRSLQQGGKDAPITKRYRGIFDARSRTNTSGVINELSLLTLDPPTFGSDPSTAVGALTQDLNRETGTPTLSIDPITGVWSRVFSDSGGKTRTPVKGEALGEGTFEVGAGTRKIDDFIAGHNLDLEVALKSQAGDLMAVGGAVAWSQALFDEVQQQSKDKVSKAQGERKQAEDKDKARLDEIEKRGQVDVATLSGIENLIERMSKLAKGGSEEEAPSGELQSTANELLEAFNKLRKPELVRDRI